MYIKSNWDEIKIIETNLNVRDSTVYFDDIDNPFNTARDRKNMRIKDDSITTINSGVGNAGCKIKIDPDETNQLENRDKGLYVPPVTWEN